MKLLAFTGLSLLAVSLIGPGRTAAGQPREASAGATLHVPAAMSWDAGPASLPRGAQFVVLEGDPSSEGPFTMRLRFPNGYRIPPHAHPQMERLTVLSGTLRLGMGEKFDEKMLRDLPAGSYGYMPGGMKHFAQARGETVVQLHGTGPWQINYVNPADDPRTAAR